MPSTRASSNQEANGTHGSQEPAPNTIRPDQPDNGMVAILQHIARQGDVLNQVLAIQNQQLQNLQTQPRIEERPTVPQMNPQIFGRLPTYDGKDLTKFRPWWSKVSIYLESYADSFKSDSIKINQVGLLLTEKAYMWHDHRYKRHKLDKECDTWDSYTKALEIRFTDKTKASRDYDRLLELKYEGNISQYLLEFMELHESGQPLGTGLRRQITKTIPRKISELVYSKHGRDPESDEDYINALEVAGEHYERMVVDGILPASGITPSKSSSTRTTKDSSKSGGVKRWPSLKEAFQGIDQTSIDQRKADLIECLRCGRDSHKTLTCYAKKDLTGRDLPRAPPLPTPLPTAAPGKVAALKRHLDEPDEEELPPPKAPKISDISEGYPSTGFYEKSDSDSDF
ncbi:hypothetical protein E4U13_008006 [Claviceps humidiphila]|uniref:Retrotransposon gag domain-containing protein n=1 Tax=Claviceps humidiphila TaxID=1294629 RepID=A0A9P7PSW4_9HYPO|nr:hypothetical protein E4U13_008006 [Claviceps humidiphila]